MTYTLRSRNFGNDNLYKNIEKIPLRCYPQQLESFCDFATKVLT